MERKEKHGDSGTSGIKQPNIQIMKPQKCIGKG
jgi:hypothetical protein